MADSLVALSGADIARRVGHMRQFGGSWLMSELGKVPVPAERATKGYFILMEPQDAGPETVGHWVLAMCVRGRWLYFDPFGVDSSTEVANFIRRCEKRHDRSCSQRMGTPERSNVDVQALRADSCGWWCMYVFMHLCRGVSLQDVVSQFSGSDQSENESQLAAWFAHNST